MYNNNETENNLVIINGQSVNLNDIEKCLLKHEFVKETFVIDREAPNGMKVIYAYVVLQDGAVISQIRETISEEIPYYMVPKHFVAMDKLSFLPDGNIDITALPDDIELRMRKVEYEAPANELEEKLINVWQNVFGLERIGVNDNFYYLGGHSILAIKLEMTLSNIGIDFGNFDLDEYETVREMAEYITRNNLITGDGQ